MKTGLIVFTLIFVSVLWLTCSQQSETEQPSLAQRQLRVVTTTGMIADMVQNVGGKRVQVTSLMGPGVDPHLYKASAGDLSRLTTADIIFYNGLHLEGKMSEVLEKMGHLKPTIAVTDGIDRTHLLRLTEFEGTPDPHIWFDVSLWIQATEFVCDELIQIDSTHAQIYQSNTGTYLTKLTELQQYVKNQMTTIPPAKRVLITAHDAFNYFGRAYSFKVRGLQGISTVAEIGTADVQSLADFIVTRQIPAIFVETSVPTRYLEALQAAVKSRGFNVIIGGKLFSDAMDAPNTPAGNYVGMVRHNTDTIVKALAGQ